MSVGAAALLYLLFYYLKKYRIVTGSNYRNAVIIGYTPESIRLKELFEKRNDYGYRFLGYFSDKKTNAQIKGKLEFWKGIRFCQYEIGFNFTKK